MNFITKKIAGMWRCVAQGTQQPYFYSSLSRKTAIEWAKSNNVVATFASQTGLNVWSKREN